MAGIDISTVKEIARRDLANYLANPTGYVFLTIFICTTGAAAFLQDEFFARNLADLALLNRVMPAVLMLFVPALTMGSWSEERRTGTDELLLTIPVRDIEVVLGKYFGSLGVYAVGLGFSLAHVLVLAYLGAPDPGLMLANYLGYLLMGALFVAVGMLASMFTGNATVAFILGALGCSALVFADVTPWAAGVVGVGLIAGLFALVWLVVRGESAGAGLAASVGAVFTAVLWVTGAWPAFETAFAGLGVRSHFYGFGEGIVMLGDLCYFIGGVVAVISVANFLLGRRHW